jgi:hypothetical protein
MRFHIRDEVTKERRCQRPKLSSPQLVSLPRRGRERARREDLEMIERPAPSQEAHG